MTLFLLMSCASSGTDKDSAPATADVILSATIDGTAIDPVEASIVAQDEDVGSEPVIANGMTGSPITVPLGAVRAWIGPATASLSSDGHRILEFDGRQWVHPIADVPLEEGGCDETSMNMVDSDGCQPTINENGYFPYELFHCTMDANEYDATDPEFKGAYIYSEEGDHWLEVTNGQDIIDEDDIGLHGFLAETCVLQSFGSTFAVSCPDDAMWTIDATWTGNGFTISASNYDAYVTELACVVE